MLYIIIRVGDPTPSKADIQVTKRLMDCAEMLGIQVLDHIVIAENGCESIMRIIN